jgi:AcrR family transcriptional regulator
MKTGLRELHKAQRRKRILDAARSIVVDEGFEGLSMRKVAERAELSVPTLYNLYQSKEDIRLSLLEESIAAIAESFAEVTATEPQARAEALLLAAVDRTTADPAFFKPAIRADAQAPWTERGRELDRTAAAMVADTLRNAIRDRLLHGRGDPDLMGAHVHACFKQAALAWSRDALDDQGFRAQVLYAFRLCLLAHAADRARPQLERDVRAIEVTLRRQGKR